MDYIFRENFQYGSAFLCEYPHLLIEIMVTINCFNYDRRAEKVVSFPTWPFTPRSYWRPARKKLTLLSCVGEKGALGDSQ